MALDRIIAEIVRCDTAPESFKVEAIDMENDGDIEVTIFSGPESADRAKEYAAARYADYRVLSENAN